MLPERILIQKSGRWAWVLGQTAPGTGNARIKIRGGKVFPLILCVVDDLYAGGSFILWRKRLRRDGVYECFLTRGGVPRRTFAVEDLALARPVHKTRAPITEQKGKRQFRLMAKMREWKNRRSDALLERLIA